MRSLLRLAATAAITALIAVPAIQAGPASASTQAGGGVTLAIDSISPRTATATSTVTVSGTVTNGTGSALDGLTVALDSTDAQFTTRDSMDDFTAARATPGLVPDGDPYAFTVTVSPGGTASWRVAFTAADAGMTQFGVYGLEAALTDSAGTILATGRELLPFWPGSSADVAQLKVAWIWPLIDQPYTQACGWLTSSSLESSLAGGGRLNGLLAAGTGAQQAQLTWAVDPALLNDAATMSNRHPVGTADCTGQQMQPASSAARDWLTSLKAATASQPVIVTPYANTDIAALVHNGLTGELTSAYQLAQAIADPILSRAFLLDVALPAGGIADQSVLTALAATEHVPSVVLGSNQMPLASGEYADDAVSSWASGAGTTMSVLLADSTLTDLLKGANTTSQAGQFAIEQQFLAQTAMIAAEAPQDPRSLVVAPPETWDPTEALAADLLQETTSAPWLKPVQLESLTGQSGDRASQPARKPLAAVRVSKRELPRAYLAKVSQLNNSLAVFTSMLSQPPAGYKQQLAAALAATESSAWRGGGTSAAQGEALITGLNQYLADAEHKVSIITGQISMAGASGELPVTIQNQLEKQTIQVRLGATITMAPGITSTLTIGPQKLVTIPPGQVKLVKLSVHKAPQGSSTINLSLISANGTVLTWTKGTKLTFNSTRYGERILLVIAGAIGLLLLSSAIRSGRRRLAAAGGPDANAGHGPDTSAGHGQDPDSGAGPDGPASQAGGEEHGSPGNVMTSAQDPTEAPDDLADARRRAVDP